MNEPVLLFCRQWPVTMALRALLKRVYTVPILPVYNWEQFICQLGEYPHSPIILGINPHEYITALYRLSSLLSGHPVLFVARRFWWVDYQLPAFVGIAACRFCTLDMLFESRIRRAEIKQFKRLSNHTCMVLELLDMTDKQILSKANLWLYKQMLDVGLSGNESMVLLLLSESLRGNLSSRLLSFYKTSGLHKLRMTNHAINLYRGLKVRLELQAPIPSPKVDSNKNRWEG